MADHATPNIDSLQPWVETRVALINRAGLHARCASLFVQEALRFPCEIRVAAANGEGDGKSIYGLIALEAVQGHELLIRASGQGAFEALIALRQLVETGFGEE